MKISNYFRFSDEGFCEVVAHDGDGQVWTRRLPPNVVASGANFIDMTILPPNTSIGIHAHSEDNSEIYIVVSGEGRMVLNGKEFDVDAGSVIVNPPGGVHGLRNTGSSNMHLAVVELIEMTKQEKWDEQD